MRDVITTDGINLLMNIDDNTKIEDVFNQFKLIDSDINQHLFTLYLLSKECNHVTEMGSRWGHSTFSILSSGVDKFIAYDLEINNNIKIAIDMAKKENINFEFIENDVLSVDIEKTDMLFIDTWHRYGQLKRELKLHSDKVNKYIVLHDTTSYEFSDEPDWGVYVDKWSLSTEKSGIWPAVDEFLLENKNWGISMRYIHNNGLTILKRRL
jgi:hypothetical protein